VVTCYKNILANFNKICLFSFSLQRWLSVLKFLIVPTKYLRAQVLWKWSVMRLTLCFFLIPSVYALTRRPYFWSHKLSFNYCVSPNNKNTKTQFKSLLLVFFTTRS
jgi:hypothetical protein